MKNQVVVDKLQRLGRCEVPNCLHGSDEFYVFISPNGTVQLLMFLDAATSSEFDSLGVEVARKLGEAQDAVQATLIRHQIDCEPECCIVFPSLSRENLVLQNKQLPIDLCLFQEDLSQLYSQNVTDHSAVTEIPFSAIEQALFPVAVWHRSRIADDDGRLTRNRIQCSLDADQRSAVCFPGIETLIVQGGPGSGKSLVLSSRAMWLCERFSASRICLLTWSKSLASALKNWLQQLEPMGGHNSGQQHQPEVMHLSEFLRKHHIPLSLSSPADADRRCQEFRIKNRVVPSYDAILVDECQDFGDELLMLLQEFICLNRGGLCVAVDMNQNIRNRPPIRFESLRSPQSQVNLNSSYRSTRSIWTISRQFVANDTQLHPSISDKNCEPVWCVWTESPQESEKMVIWEVKRLLAKGDFRLSDFLIIHFHAEQRLRIRRALGDTFGYASADPDDRECVRVYSPEVAKGHEASVVFVLGWDDNPETNRQTDLSSLLYVACSRAIDMLYLIYCKQSNLLPLEDESHVHPQIWPDDFNSTH